MARRSFQTLVTLSCLCGSSLADKLVEKDYCDAANPVVVTYTETVYAATEYFTSYGFPNEPSVTNEGVVYNYNPTVTAHKADYTHSYSVDHVHSYPTDHTGVHPAEYTSALSYNPYPIAPEQETCFNRSSTVGYAHNSYEPYSGKSKTSDPTSGGGYYQSLPIYGKPNATSAYHPTGTGASSTVSVSRNTTVPTPPPCTPGIELDGVDELAYNAKNTPFSVKLTSCAKFQVDSTTAFANFKAIPELTVTEDTITFPGFTEDYVLISVFALDTNESPIIESWELHFGSVNMPILILNPDDTPAEGVRVKADATAYPGLTGSCTTDVSGQCTLQNLPGTTISLVARKDDNSIAVNGLAPTTVQVTLKLLPFVTPNPDASFEIDNGMAGWTGGQLQQSLKIKRDTTLVVNTNGQYTLQSASNSFPASEGTKQVYIKYRFITSEVPGGFFG
ncbi:hypothetical protein P154DRAFT_48574 [Amniculicola lignicola CBS 123094]|uniref:Uncharacterized protein n=1 Tax=Amniculicola lignicola CBS 123094 TaxID=1392246 RepID=A0A6A5VWF1_9PLEO|nr:hypothetical protein P154DRAFT_48574 [Amniculicola lignicola CBS 123094]